MPPGGAAEPDDGRGRRADGGAPGPVLTWAIVVAGGLVVTGLFALAHLPSPPLFGFLFAAMIYAVGAPSRWRRPELPARGSRLGQGIVGAGMGAYIDLPTLAQLGGHAAPIAAVTLATLLACLVAGQLLARFGRVSAATGIFAMVAGGASGVTAVARELGADDRVVGVVQYLRVVLILVGMPVVTAVVFRPEPTVASSTVVGESPPAADLAFTVVAVLVGLVAARVISFPSASLLLPLFVATVVSLTGLLGSPGVPGVVQGVGFALIGLQVGLRFTAESLRRIARLLPVAVALILGVVVVSAALGVVLAAAAGKTELDGYLATTPGGLYAVLATAVDAGADVTFILAVQVIRLVVVLATAPLLAAWLRRRARRA